MFFRRRICSMKKMKKYLGILAAVAVCIGMFGQNPVRVSAAQNENALMGGIPMVYTDITTQTDKVKVYVILPFSKSVTLKIENQSQVIFKKTYKKEGKKTITIPKQKAGTKLKFTLSDKHGVLLVETKKVKDDGVISDRKVDSSLKKPKVDGEITDQSLSVNVYAKKGETLYIQNGGKVLKKVKYTKSGYQTHAIKKQKAETKLTFYVTGKKGGRSRYVTKEVKDITPPGKPKISFPMDREEYDAWPDYEYEAAKYDVISVSGERGTKVYLKQNSNYEQGSYKYLGFMTRKTAEFELNSKVIQKLHVGDTLSVRLVDDAGNISEPAITAPVEKVEITEWDFEW